MKCRIKKMDHTGDSTLATYDPTETESVTVAQDALTAFLDECVQRHGTEPPVWGRRNGKSDYDQIDPRSVDLPSVEEVVIHDPLVGG